MPWIKKTGHRCRFFSPEQNWGQGKRSEVRGRKSESRSQRQRSTTRLRQPPLQQNSRPCLIVSRLLPPSSTATLRGFTGHFAHPTRSIAMASLVGDCAALWDTAKAERTSGNAQPAEKKPSASPPRKTKRRRRRNSTTESRWLRVERLSRRSGFELPSEEPPSRRLLSLPKACSLRRVASAGERFRSRPIFRNPLKI
jgi:hypothetical protein